MEGQERFIHTHDLFDEDFTDTVTIVEFFWYLQGLKSAIDELRLGDVKRLETLFDFFVGDYQQAFETLQKGRTYVERKKAEQSQCGTIPETEISGDE